MKLFIKILIIKVIGELIGFFTERGFYKTCLHISKIFNTKGLVRKKLNTDTTIYFDSNDPYWLRLFINSFSYESEIVFILRKLKKINYTFFDFGANIGYWSLLASSKEFGSQPTLAVEPDYENFKILEKNRITNQQRFDTLNKAISNESNKYLTFYVDQGASRVGGKIFMNPGMSNNSDNSFIVKTVTIDEVTRNHENLVIKLDIEGAELISLQAAINTINKNPIFIYEDHGMSNKTELPKWFFTNGFLLFYYSRNRLQKIDNINHVQKIKSDKTKGYNFIAMRQISIFYGSLINEK